MCGFMAELVLELLHVGHVYLNTHEMGELVLIVSYRACAASVSSWLICLSVKLLGRRSMSAKQPMA
jgi:hypothetical protein